MSNQVVVIAGPAGSGKDTIIDRLLERCSNTTRMVTANTRAPRPGEVDGVNYHFMTNEQFKDEMEKGNILEHYYREKTDTYYGTFKPDLEKRIASGRVVLAQITIVGAKYLKEHYNATTFFIMPSSLEDLERRIRARAPMSDAEWHERMEFTRREIETEASWYDYRIPNEDGKLDETVETIVEILRKEGYNLG
ncbi:guanylate kinase [bacterium]|nr:guanylate kinase [bacterium]